MTGRARQPPGSVSFQVALFVDRATWKLAPPSGQNRQREIVPVPAAVADLRVAWPSGTTLPSGRPSKVPTMGLALVLLIATSSRPAGTSCAIRRSTGLKVALPSIVTPLALSKSISIGSALDVPFVFRTGGEGDGRPGFKTSIVIAHGVTPGTQLSSGVDRDRTVDRIAPMQAPTVDHHWSGAGGGAGGDLKLKVPLLTVMPPVKSLGTRARVKSSQSW